MTSLRPTPGRRPRRTGSRSTAMAACRTAAPSPSASRSASPPPRWNRPTSPPTPVPNMLWHALRNHGAMIRDSAGSGNTITIQADQNVNGNDPLILGMEQYSAADHGAGRDPGQPGAEQHQRRRHADRAARSRAERRRPATPRRRLRRRLHPTPTPTSAASPNDTMVLAGATNAITDASGDTWTITASARSR